ncbi:helix-turn-helix domain-containing protein [Rhodobacterales bacterium HKCCE4037]|nr:helix-turn-helix domain-containing protein [Rhodobacterales bacterium HKCCE4037]
MTEMTFAKRLQRVIDNDPKLTVAGLSVKAGLDNSALRSLLSGRVKNPRLDTAMKVCAALGTTLEDFMSGAYEQAGDDRSSEDQRIRDLLSQLSVDERQLLLSYGEGLRDAPAKGNREPPEDAE